MLERKVRYLASVFLDADSVVPSAHDIAELTAMLGDDLFLPVTVQELGPGGAKARMAFQSADGGWLLVLSGQRFDLSRLSLDLKGSDLGEFSAFCEQAITRLGFPMQYFKRNGHRLAAVQEGYLGEIGVSALNEIALRLLKLPGTYSSNIPYEWDWRACSQIEREFGDVNEPTNTITTIKRVSAVVTQTVSPLQSMQALDGIRVDLDVNTLQSNTVSRFGQNELRGFFEKASSWHSQLSEEIMSFILGRDKKP